MVKKIALEEHFLCPGFVDYWNPTVGDLPTRRIASRRWRACTDFGEHAPCRDGPRRHRARGARRSPGPACRPSATRATAIRKARERQRLPGARDPEAAGPLFRASRTCRCRTPTPPPIELERCMRELEILRRHDQRPHQRAISRRSGALSVLGARRGAGRADLSASGRSGRRRRRCSRATRGCAAPPGNGRSRPARMRCGSIFGGVFDRFPRAKLGARPPGRDAAVPALALRQPRRTSFYAHQARQDARRNTSRTTSW